MDPYAELLTAYRRKGLLIDSNLLVLFFVGVCDPRRITTFKRTRMFTFADFELLVGILKRFDRVTTTPNILTEVSNFLGQVPGHARNFFNTFSARMKDIEEAYQPSQLLASRDYFPDFGLTDSSIIEEARGKYLVLTVDLPLYSYLSGVGIDVINFNHLRLPELLS